MSKDKKDVGHKDLWRIPKDLMGYEGAKKPAFMLAETPKKIAVLARRTADRCISYALRRVSRQLLDQALRDKGRR